MKSRGRINLEKSEYQPTLFKHTSIPQPDVGKIELYLSVSETNKKIQCILRAFPKSLSPDKVENRIEYNAECSLSNEDINSLFQDIKNIFKEYPNPEKHFDSFNTSNDADSTNKNLISRVQGTGIRVSNRYLENILEIEKSRLLSCVPSATRSCQIF